MTTQALGLGSSLFVFWLLLSGHGEPMLLGLGLLSTVLTVILARRFAILDHEGHPSHFGIRAPLYWAWLLGEITKSGLAVARIILSPSLPIQPRVIEVYAGQHTDLGRVIYANSITLTPGTVTLRIEGSRLRVHALTEGAAEDLQLGEMDRRVSRLEGPAAPESIDPPEPGGNQP